MKWFSTLRFAVIGLILFSGQAYANRTIDSVDFSGASTVYVTAGATISTTVHVTTSWWWGGDDNWRSTGWLIATSPPGSISCENTSNYNSSGTHNETFTITAPTTNGTYNAYFIAYSDNSCSSGASAVYTLPNAVTVGPPPPTVTAINRASVDPTAANTEVAWTVTFSESVTGVDVTDFSLAMAGGASGAYLISVSGSGASWTVVANTGTGFSGTVGLNLIDNDSIVNSAGTPLGGDFTGQTYTLLPPPLVTSIDRASFDPTTANTAVSWTVVFSESVTGVDTSDFTLVQSGGTTGASITSVTGSGTTWTVTANTGTGSPGTLRLDLIDDDSIIGSSGTVLGYVGTGNGNFSGQYYTLLAATCTGAADVIFCDDFERSNPETVGNGWTVTEANSWNCSGTTGNRRCAGIDSDIPPFDVYSNPRANPTRSMFTRWDEVSVDSPAINLSGRSGAQLSFWMRRGGDAFSEYPEASGEDYLLLYLDNTGTWQTLAQYPTGVMQGQVFTPTIELPPDALHANFQLRFYQPTGSGDSGSGGAPGVRGYDYWHLDNVIIREVAEPKFVGAFCDNFEGGLGRWSITAEEAPATAPIGEASLGTITYQSASHSLDMRWGYVVASTFKTDLTGVTGDITYWLRSGTNTTRDPDSGEDLVVEYLNDTGSWTTLQTYLGSASIGTTFNGSHTLPDNAKHANFRLRFRHLDGSGFDTDYWHLDDVCVGDLVATADLALTKSGGTLVPGTSANYTLTVTNNGPGILSGSVEIVDTLPSELSYLTHTGTGWSCGANGQTVTCNWSGTLNPGAAAPPLTLTVNVSGSASGTITNTATVSGTVADNVPANNTASHSTTIYVPAYVFTDRACTSGIAIGSGATPCNLVSWSPQVAGQVQGNVYITALNASGIPTQLHATNTTTVDMQFGLSCHNPTSNAGVQASFSAASADLPLCTAGGATPTSWTTAAGLDFPAGSPSVGPYSFNYNDVGSVELFMRNSAATSQIGTSGQFVVKPAGFVLSEIKPTANPTGRCAVNTSPAPAVTCASDASGNLFVKAGEAFSVTVTAVNVSGNATPNYGNETTAEGVLLTPTPVSGLGLVNNPAIAYTTGFGGFTSGVATGTDFSWGEVGIINLIPSIADADYLGGGNVTGTQAGPVGRFYPDHFDIAHTPVPSCNGTFTYAGLSGISGKNGQPFQVTGTITAKNAAGGTTQNYDGNFAKLLAGGISAAPWVSGALVTDELVWSVDSLNFNNGVGGQGDFAETNARYNFNSEGPPQLMYLHVSANDGEATGSVIDNTKTVNYRYGRMRLINAYGPELMALAVPFQAEYYDTNGYYVMSGNDGCTTLTLAANLQLSVDNGANWVSGDNPVNVGGGSTVASLASASPLSSGDAGLSFSAPAAGNTGYVDIRTQLAASYPWLLFDWNGDGTQDDASGRVNFGLYQGSPHHIYLRERY